jgi:carbon monoxide dehydrogenase subunit G
MLKNIALALAVVLGALGVLIALQPGAYKVTRSTQIAAPPAAAFALINDFHNWDAWSPWAKLDPNMKTTYSGPASGTGASYHWSSPMDNVGEGRMTITNSVPAERVEIKLEFIKPFASVARTEFTIQPSASGSSVEWTMNGESDFMAKAFGLFMGGMDKMIGPDFEKGLTQMKSAAEKK